MKKTNLDDFESILLLRERNKADYTKLHEHYMLYLLYRLSYRLLSKIIALISICFAFVGDMFLRSFDLFLLN